jgi:hypothetical protein
MDQLADPISDQLGNIPALDHCKENVSGNSKIWFANSNDLFSL